jgi:hypothetical protein
MLGPGKSAVRSLSSRSSLGSPEAPIHYVEVAPNFGVIYGTMRRYRQSSSGRPSKLNFSRKVLTVEESHWNLVQRIFLENPRLRIYLAVLFEMVALEEMESMRLTFGTWMTPSGRWQDREIPAEHW